MLSCRNIIESTAGLCWLFRRGPLASWFSPFWWIGPFPQQSCYPALPPASLSRALRVAVSTRASHLSALQSVCSAHMLSCASLKSSVCVPVPYAGTVPALVAVLSLNEWKLCPFSEEEARPWCHLYSQTPEPANSVLFIHGRHCREWGERAPFLILDHVS